MIVTRIFPKGGKHLGPKRWEYVRQCTVNAIKNTGFTTTLGGQNPWKKVGSQHDPHSVKALLLGDSIYSKLDYKSFLKAPSYDSATTILSQSNSKQQRKYIIVGTGTNNRKF